MVRVPLGLRSVLEIAAVDEIDVEMPVIVVIEKESARSHRFWEVFLFGCTVNVFEMDTGLLRLIRKVECCFSRGRYHSAADKYQAGE